MNRATPHRLWMAACLILTGTCLPLWAQEPRPSVSAAMEVTSTNVFENEEFTLTFIVEIKGVRVQKDIGVSSLPGSTVLHLGPFSELPTRQFTENGQACEVRRSFCRARARVTGPLEIAPTLRIGVLTGRSLFFTDEEEAVDLRVQPLTLHVRPLPQTGRPADFSGAVGQFAFDVTVAPTRVAPGALIYITPRIRGTGFLETVSAPRVTQSPYFRIYDPKPLPASAGEAAFEQIIVPHDTNAPAVPAISFSYFDPNTRSYQTIARGPTRLVFVAATSAPAAFEPYRPPVQDTNVAPPGASPDATAPASAWSVREWLAAAISSAILLVMIAGIGAIFPRRRPAIHVILLLVLAVLVAFSLYRALAAGWLAAPEAIVIKHESARLAPAYTAAASFELPTGARVRTAEVRGNWAKVSLGHKRGWVPANALRQP